MENEQLVARIQAGEDEAGNMLQLWEQNQRFISSIAVKFSGYEELDDLKQEGYISLCNAVRHYDAEQGVPFINYAAFWIRQGLQRYIENCCGAVRIPVGVQTDIRKYKKISNEFQKEYGREASANPSGKRTEILPWGMPCRLALIWKRIPCRRLTQRL